jgi:SNF2 family DNA or RNA helicase
LIDVLEDTSDKVIVFYLHIAEGELLQKALEKRKIGFRMIKGGQSREERSSAEKDFRNVPKVQCMLTQIGSGCEGWDGSCATLLVFFTLVASPKIRKQCIGRMHRKGQTRPCMVLDLFLKHSVDAGVVKNRGKRMDFVACAMEYMREYGGVENI